MIAPFLPMRLSAILWYQGEANDIGKKARCVGEAEYECLFPAMITGWRRRFDDMTLPFFYVLLAAGHTAELREAQYTGAGALRRTAFASAMDIGASAAEETIPGHPPRKQEVGRRLSLAMRAIMRGETGVDYKGPTVIASKTSFVSQSKTKTSVTLTFDVGSNGFLHFNDTALCNKSSVPPNLTKTAATMAAPRSLVCCASTGQPNHFAPVQFRDPDDASGKILHATSFSLNTTANTLTASLSPALVTKNNRVEVRFLFDNAPLCAVYNGELSGPDSVYATIKHYGIVAQSWRANVTVRQNEL